MHDCSLPRTALSNALRLFDQDTVGSVVKTSEEDDPIAVFTVLNTLRHKDQEWMKQLQEFLSGACKDAEMKKQMQEAFDQEGTGLLVNERLINSPPKLAPPLMQFLFDEVRKAGEDKSLDKATRESFRFKRYIVVTRVYADNEPAAAGPSGKDVAGPSSKKQKMASASQASGPSSKASCDPVLVYLRPEDEFLHRHCSWSCTFPVAGKVVGKDDLHPLRCGMLEVKLLGMLV